MENRMTLTIFLFLLITCIIKDIIEIFLGFIPGINLFVWVIVLPLVIYIFVITLMSGIRGTWIFIGQALDLIPFASILPIATLTVILVYAFQKSPAPVKKAVKTAAKFTPKKSLKSPDPVKI
jgi:hypothetical protein